MITTVCGNLHAIGNHADRLALRVFEFQCWLIARECIVVIWQIDDSRLTRVVAAEESWALVESFADERGNWWNNRHSRQACTERLDICGQDLRAVGEVVRCVGTVVVDDDDVNGAVEKRPDRVVLES